MTTRKKRKDEGKKEKSSCGYGYESDCLLDVIKT